ncbi:hypothetical protein P7C70_g5051, partial [Phenoliferia sp. Uapishka_3]
MAPADAILATPSNVCLPAGSFLVEDADEEIFLLYMEKQKSVLADDGLGSVTSNEDMIPISISVQERAVASGEKGSYVERSAKGKKAKKERKQVTVELELYQDLGSLRNRPGDTGSVLWRVSLHLAKYILAQHHFPPPQRLFPTWSTGSVLELGSGTGFLGLAIGSTVKSWTFSDQLASLDLLLRNRRKNAKVGEPPLGLVREVDWIDESLEAARLAANPNSSNRTTEDAPFPDFIVAADCIYNPAISVPLARTIDNLAGPQTVALVASELRDNEPLELFLREWLRLGWTVARLIFPPEEQDGIGSLRFVVWVGWKEKARSNN